MDGTPSILNDVEAELAVLVHIRVKHVCRKSYPGRLCRVLLRKDHPQGKDAPFPGRLVRAKNLALPDEEVVITQRACAASFWRFLLDGFQIRHKPKLRRRVHFMPALQYFEEKCC